jgi:ABC-type transport system involved in cytochrome bd biosynthesis fused ATPase/permease subunit
VEEYNNIEKQGFNFSSKYKFDFDYDKKELKCEENPNSVEEGFFGENITNITAIIGKNGSGKSSVLELLKGIINNEKGAFL